LNEINDSRSLLRFREKFAELLLEWRRLNKRDFPRRRTTDPYKILITEMLLRKTTARQVSGIFDKIFAKFPDANTLAEARDEEIEAIIRPLGMEHKRVVLLKKLAKELSKRHMDTVPANPEDLRRLVKVGDTIRVENGFVRSFKGQLELNVGSKGKIVVVSRHDHSDTKLFHHRLAVWRPYGKY
jgi:adenine-specific DNA glycosylase